MMKIRFAIVLNLLTAGLLTIGTGCERPSAADTTGGPGNREAPLARVIAAKPALKPLSRHTTQPARIEAFEETPLFVKLAGYVEQVHVDIGDSITKGQALVTLRIPELHDELRQKAALIDQAAAEIQQAEANVHAAEADVATNESRIAEVEAGLERADGEFERWKAEFERISQLAERGTITGKLVDETQNQLRSATSGRKEAAARITTVKAALAQSQAALERARADVLVAHAQHVVAKAQHAQTETLLQYAVIRAPYDGVVTTRNVDTEHFVQPGSGAATKPLLVVARMDKVRVFVDIPELETAMLDAGDPAVVHVQALGKRSFEGTVTRDSWALDDSNRSLRAEIDLPNPDRALRPGMYALATILLEARDQALVLPTTAILRNASGEYCMCVEEGKIQPRAVELGLRNGDEIEVLSGVTGDDLVVTARGESLSAGQSVEILENPQ